MACFVEEPSSFEYRDGLFRIVQMVGNRRYECVMSPHVFMRALRRGAECAKEHYSAGAEVIAFPREAARH